MTVAMPPTESSIPTGAPWVVERHKVVATTQSVARELSVWSAVIAEIQTGGRGQYDRTFVSDAGGFYLTAVLPFDGDSARWRGFALAVGWAVRAKLLAAGITDVRMRWPNDLMIGTHKVGGILVEQGGRHTLLVGMGINVGNQPWLRDEALRGIATRLVDQPGCSLMTPDQLEAPILTALAEAYGDFIRSGGLAGLVTTLNGGWSDSRRVELTLGEGPLPEVLVGSFLGIDREGNLLIKTASQAIVTVPENRVKRLREL